MPGSGLGLAIVRQVIERHGGQVRVESAPGHVAAADGVGKGARFAVWLPGSADASPPL